MLSHPLISPDGKRLAVPIVNYIGYAMEGITVHLEGKWNKARRLAPGRDARELVLYDIKDGKGLEIAGIDFMAIQYGCGLDAPDEADILIGLL